MNIDKKLRVYLWKLIHASKYEKHIQYSELAIRILERENNTITEHELTMLINNGYRP
jgi:hypothetical protein